MDFLQDSSYINNTYSSLNVMIKKDINIENRYIIIFDDTINTGATHNKIVACLKSKNFKEIKIFIPFNKLHRRLIKLKIDYTEFEIKNVLIVGHGIKLNKKYRTLKNVV
ncbi:phosphoribosyltransferase family protein [Borrelia anserina]|uniref:Hypoxanthine-guanine phosphoribosyltransferase n=2 Tax=Borrelia anserina TaxID=143 RepID=W5STR3_BORAN|nr:phosphoribosyltransferase family protein [Borrelia anserina]AHH08396.1 Hypoxanthine-guanine phosphoribosyltransferase [Borrelia anserina BA2]